MSDDNSPPDDIFDRYSRDKKPDQNPDAKADEHDEIFSKYSRSDVDIEKREGKPTKVIMHMDEPRGDVLNAGGFNNRLASSVPVLGPLVDKAAAATGAAIQPVTDMIRQAQGKEPQYADTSFGDRYANNLQMQNEKNAQYADQHPLAAFGADVVGNGMLLGPASGTALGARAMGMTGTSLGTKVLQGAGGMGALESGNQLVKGNNPLDQGFAGPVPLAAAFGAAGPVAGEAISSIGSKIADMLPRTSGPLAGTNTIVRNKLTNALEAETPASIGAAKDAFGSSGMMMDTNQATRDITGGLADIPGQHKSDIREVLRQRAAGQTQRLLDTLDRNTVPDTNVANLTRSIEQARSTGADPLYNQFRTMQIQPTKEIKALIPRLEKAGAFDKAEELSGISGRPIDRKFFTGGSQKSFPTAETWDYIKRGLDRRIGDALDKTKPDKDLARELLNLKTQMLAEIDKTPAGKVYQQAREAYAEPSEILHQIQEGRKTFSRATDKEELAHELNSLSGPELSARVQGARKAIQDMIDLSVRGDTTARNTLLSRTNQAKLEMLFGDKRAGRLIGDLEAELNVSKSKDEMVGGSPTSSKQARRNELMPQKSEPGYLRNIDLTHPASLIPDWMTPQAMMEGAASARHATAHQQLANLMQIRMGSPEYDQLIQAIMDEGAKKSALAGKFDRAGSRSSLALQTIEPALRNRLLAPPSGQR